MIGVTKHYGPMLLQVPNFGPDPKRMLRFYLNIAVGFRIFRESASFRRLRALARGSAFRFMEIIYFADEICPKMRKLNVLEVTLTSPASRTHFTQTPYKTLILTRLLKETTVPLTVSVLSHQLAQTLLLKDRAVTAFPLHQNNGKGPVEWK
jgi:hypothetical protein